MLLFVAKMATKKVHNIVRTKQVDDVLRFLAKTPAPASLLLKASIAFGTPEQPGRFSDLRRVRERMESLATAGFVSIERYAVSGRQPTNFYHLTRAGYRLLYEVDPPQHFRSLFRRVANATQEHMYDLSRLVTKIVVDAHGSGTALAWFMPENAFVADAGSYRTKPDLSIVFEHSVQRFNCFFERDRHTESIDSMSPNSVRSKIVAYEAYYDLLMHRWKTGVIKGTRPRLRVPFWTDSIERAEHILSLASRLAANPHRLLVYAATMDSFLNEGDALRTPLFLDHTGNWQALVNIHPTSPFLRDPVRFRSEFVEPMPAIC